MESDSVILEDNNDDDSETSRVLVQQVKEEEEEEEEEEEGLDEIESFDSLSQDDDDVEALAQEYAINPLRSEMMPDCLSMLCKTADGMGLALVKFDAVGFNLTNITSISSYVHLRYVDLSHNKIKDISALKSLPNLITLIMSDNILSSIQLLPLEYLQVLNFSNNYLNVAAGVYHTSLTYLDISGNRIRNMAGSKVSSLNFLRKLQLNGNRLTSVGGLECSNLRELYLANNKLRSLEDLGVLPKLEQLHLRKNKLRTLDGLSNALRHLTYLNLRDNRIKYLANVQELESLTGLKALVLLENPITDIENYRQEILMLCPSLMRLDKESFNELEHTEAEEVRSERKVTRTVQESAKAKLKEEKEEANDDDDEDDDD